MPTVVGSFPSRNSQRKGSFDRRENNPIVHLMVKPQARLQGHADTKKHTDGSRWFSFSEFAVKGITRLKGG
jgi:hypothetical protein